MISLSPNVASLMVPGWTGQYAPNAQNYMSCLGEHKPEIGNSCVAATGFLLEIDCMWLLIRCL